MPSHNEDSKDENTEFSNAFKYQLNRFLEENRPSQKYIDTISSVLKTQLQIQNSKLEDKMRKEMNETLDKHLNALTIQTRKTEKRVFVLKSHFDNRLSEIDKTYSNKFTRLATIITVVGVVITLIATVVSGVFSGAGVK